MNAEEVYDEEIAPLLKSVGEMCEKYGFSFVAVCEWTPGDCGITLTRREGAGVGFRLTEMAALARGNMDSLAISAARYGKEHGHNSVVLSLLERPTS